MCWRMQAGVVEKQIINRITRLRVACALRGWDSHSLPYTVYVLGYMQLLPQQGLLPSQPLQQRGSHTAYNAG